MGYIEGFVGSVPEENRQAYKEHAAQAAALFKEFGATRVVECWGDDVPDGKITDFRRAVQAKDGEIIVFSWIEYPSKDARDNAWKQLMNDPRMQEVGAAMPFDGKRMIHGGFETLLDV